MIAKTIKSFIKIVMILTLIWFVLSYIEVVSKNLGSAPIYNNLNIFKILFLK